MSLIPQSYVILEEWENSEVEDWRYSQHVLCAWHMVYYQNKGKLLNFRNLSCWQIPLYVHGAMTRELKLCIRDTNY